MKHFETLAVVDCNTFIGNWAFRRLRNNDAVGLLKMMDQFGIERACVASADAILYRDCQAGNQKLYEETRFAADRFWLYATLNPAYAGWERDLNRCIEQGFSALRLYPTYHNYPLDGPEARAIAGAAVEAGLPISIPCRVEDIRQRHWMDAAENVEPMAVVALAESFPKGAFLITESYLPSEVDNEIWRRMRNTGCHIELSRMTSCLGANLQVACRELGPERLLFGTGYPFKTPSPAFLKLQVLDADESAKGLIAGGNAYRIMGGECPKR